MFSSEGYWTKSKCFPVLFNSYFLLVLCLLTTDSVTSKPFKLAQSPNCGTTDKSLEDIRASVPWTAAIFRTSPGSKSGYQFYVTGTIISDTTVLTVAGGVFGAFPRGAKSKYFISPPSSYMIGVGLNSTSLEQKDHFSQFSEVKYILPYNDHVRSNKHYHYLLFHLKTPLNLTTPYVKAVCLPTFLSDTNLGTFKWKYIQGGYAKPALPDGSFPLKQFVITTGSQEECNSIFRYYYKGSGSGDAQHTFCGRRSEKDPGGEDVCHLHGSVNVFGVLDRWYLTGITALIPAQKRGECGRSTNYIYSEELLYLKGKSTMEWIIRSANCSPDQYSCKNGTCIPLSSVCNLIPDCEGGSDEDSTYCSAVNTCSDPERNQPCGLGGKCISKDQICDKRVDCADGSDESEAACDKVSGGNILLLQRSQRSCPSLNLTPGVIANCKSQITRDVLSCDGELDPGTAAVLTCDKYTTPLYSISSVELECDERSRWRPSLPFSCETVCGEVKNIPGSKSSENRLPWNVALYQHTGGKYNLHCSGTLIEPSFLLTAANCLSEASNLDSTELLTFLKVVVSPISNDFAANSKDSVAQILDVKQIWIPKSYNNTTKSSEVALLKLGKPVKLGGYVRPICYNNGVSASMPEPGKNGKVSIFSNSDTPSPIKFHDFSVISQEACSKMMGSDVRSIFTFCAGLKNGAGVCGKNNGAGIYFQTGTEKSSKFVLEGVVTQGHLGSAATCNTNSYTEFTSVQVFDDWLVKILEKHS